MLIQRCARLIEDRFINAVLDIVLTCDVEVVAAEAAHAKRAEVLKAWIHFEVL
jgi:hypothetical protein